MEILRKKKIYVPDGSLWWAKTHAMTPTVDLMDDRIRVYFSSLDDKKIGRIGYVDLDKENPEKIIAIAKEPVLDIGMDGTFDDNGLAPCSILTHENKKYLYYHGFMLQNKVRFSLLTGVAVSTDNGLTFKRHSRAPLLDRCEDDIFIRSLPHVIKEDKTYKIWYNGVSEWIDVTGKKLPVGHIRFMESDSPVNFSGSRIYHCLSPEGNEFSLSRPFVFKKENLYRMLFSIRYIGTDIYKPGYAESNNGKEWIRKDHVLKVQPSHEKWDDEMMCYTSLVTVNDRNYVFYNGNGFGATGFGYAEIKF